MDECLYEELARRMWEAINPQGLRWEHIAQDEIKERMRGEAKVFLERLAINPQFSMGQFRKYFRVDAVAAEAVAR